MVDIENNPELTCDHIVEFNANVCSECGALINSFGYVDDEEFPFENGYWSCPNCGSKLPITH